MMKKNVLSTAIKNKIGARKWTSIKYFMLAIPFLVFIFAFSYVPLLGWTYAFFEYKPGRMFYDVEWVGFKFFKKLFTDAEMVRVMRNTLVMSFSFIALSPSGIFMAILFNDVKNAKVKKTIQTVTTLPNFISWVIVFGLAQSIFSANGMWNKLLEAVGLTGTKFGIIGDINYVWGFQLALGIWKSLGWTCIIYIAAISGIDAELYDAAKVDGANKVQQIRHITIPGMIPAYLVQLLLGISNILSNGFEQYYMFWNSLTSDRIEVLDYYVYRVAMKNMQYSYSIAVGMVKSFVGIILLFSVNWVSKKVRGNSLF